MARITKSPRSMSAKKRPGAIGNAAMAAITLASTIEGARTKSTWRCSPASRPARDGDIRLRARRAGLGDVADHLLASDELPELEMLLLEVEHDDRREAAASTAADT